MKTLCFILSYVFFLFRLLKKTRKEKYTMCCVARKRYLNALLFLTFLINNIVEQKRLEIKHTLLKTERD